MKKDIEGRDIEPGDLVMRPSNSNLVKAYALYYTKSGKLIMSCKRTKVKYSKTLSVDWEYYLRPEEHDGIQNAPYSWGNLYILKKKCEIPEKLKKYMRNG